MRQELNNASHRCENLGSMESLDQSEQEIISPMMQLADDVNGQIKDCIAQVYFHFVDLSFKYLLLCSVKFNLHSINKICKVAKLEKSISCEYVVI